MRTLFLLLAVLTGGSSQLFAGSNNLPFVAESTDILPESSANWGGFYIGGMSQFARGTLTYSYQGDFVYDLVPEVLYGGFAGYNLPLGQIVIGGEIAVSAGGMSPEGYPAETHGPFIDLKARFGIPIGSALIYGSGGVSMSDYRDGSIVTWEYVGQNYGIGVDYKIIENFFVGVEYSVRVFSASASGPVTAISRIQGAQLRVGLKF